MKLEDYHPFWHRYRREGDEEEAPVYLNPMKIRGAGRTPLASAKGVQTSKSGTFKGLRKLGNNSTKLVHVLVSGDVAKDSLASILFMNGCIMEVG